MNLSISQRIYSSFTLLVLLFVANTIATIITLNHTMKLSEDISTVIDPMLQGLEDFEDILVESKMYTTNWVFLRSNQEDKDALIKLHNADYPKLKLRLNVLFSKLDNKSMADSLNKLYTEFEQLLPLEREIMASLNKFKDYDEPVTKLEAERKLDDEVLPRTSIVINRLFKMISNTRDVRIQKNNDFERSSIRLGILISILAIVIIFIGFFLSIYMTRVIVRPIHKIRQIVNDLGKGIIRKVDYKPGKDEIGEMIFSINNLSEKVQAAATFAHEVGQRNFKAPFQPMSEEDTLGKSLISMRDNLSKGEVNLEIKNKELERKNKELEQFAYVASHDLQEPLRTISSFVELLQHQYIGRLDEHADKYLAYIVQSSDRMKVLIKDLLDYSRIGNKRELQKVDCKKILVEVLEDIGQAINDENAVIKVNDLPVINAYPTEIKQLFQNLITNAIKFRKKNIAPLVQISAEKSDTHWTFTVKDNGIGIEEIYKERIFIIFQRLHTRTEYEGSGIGLSHCKKIVELHGGKIWIDSKPGEGTIFHFTILQNNS